MAKSGWSCVVFGVLVTCVVACSKPAIEEDREFTATDEPPILLQPTEAADIPSDPTKPLPTQVDPTNSPPPLPTAEPTTSLFSDWQQAGGEAAGLQLLAPPSWINLSGQLDTPATANELGLLVLLMADSARTGDSLLSGKPIGAGSYVAGFVSHRELPPNTPQTTLSQLLVDLNKNVTSLDEPMPITAFTASGNRVTGAYVDVQGEPFLFSSNVQQDIQTRVFFFASTLAGAANQHTQAIFTMSAPVSYWAEAGPVFNEIAKTIVIHNIESHYMIRDGAANVVGELAEMDLANGELENNVKDVWTFRIEEERYATLTLSSDNDALDLTLTLISPSGQTIARVDNGYAGDTETAVDQLLLENGLYVVEIGEFFNEPGPYTLSLVLTEQPLFGDGGEMRIGQTIQGDLPAEGEHLWRFSADAGTIISAVLDPANFDVILDIFAPDGRQLAELDEGFSGDAEIVSGLELPLTGEYIVLVRSFAGDGGSYSLSVDEGSDDTLNFYDAGDLSYGLTRQETLQANEAHAWFFDGRGGDDIMVEVVPLSDNLDLDIWLLDPNIERLTTVDEFLVGEPEYFSFRLPQDGQFLILVRDFFGEAGSYEITLNGMTAVAPDTAGQLSSGEAAGGALLPEQTVIWYFEGEEGETVTIEVAATDGQADLQFMLVDPLGNRILQVDHAEDGQTERLENYGLTVAGQWGVIVTEFFGEAADYTIEVEIGP